jgi:hypothetical protein
VAVDSISLATAALPDELWTALSLSSPQG